MIRQILTFLFCLLLVSPRLAAQDAAGKKSVRMGVLLPLKERTARGTKMVEFYRGLLMAVDSLKRDGVSVDVQALHAGSSASEMDQMLASHALKDCDVVFGPLDAAQLPALADYCYLHDIHLVVPFTSLATQLIGHPRHYLVTAPRNRIQDEAVWYIQDQFSDYNIILVETNESNEEGTAFGERLRAAMSQKGIYVRQLNLEADDLAFLQAFNPQRKNLIIPNSPSLKALNNLTSKLKDFQRAHSEYELALFGYPAWQTYTQQLLPDFYQLNTYAYTTFYRNPLSQRNEAFDRQFMNWFHTPMSNTFPRYALMGFDLGYFFLRGLAIYGRDRLTDAITQVPARPYQHPFHFEQSGDGNGYVNTFVELIHYTPQQSIELITRNR
ncbi:MAG: hypothetical protein IJ700_02315 [Bacteroidaceae bacterium]|nr:hypothetical protein [Bacteroidaceae bacterium]MBR1755085.1 hypothetical protein [Bacteroidaceae bacterium]